MKKLYIFALMRHDDPKRFANNFDSGDHLHPSAKAYEAMAECVPEELLKGTSKNCFDKII